MRAADWLIDIGPGAGALGGQVVSAGTPQQVMADPNSLTGQYLSGKKRIEVPAHRRPGSGKWLTVRGAKENNLKNIDVSVPLGTLTCVTGVSGSGKSSLVNEIIFKRLGADLNRMKAHPGRHDAIEGEEHLDKVINIDQSPIGRTPRSNPATYTGVFNDIRTVFSQTQDAKMRGYGPGRFSFNVRGGRCEACEGNGILQIEMHFLPDVYVPCEVCKGARYNRETLEVKYKEKTISDVLNMTVEEAVVFFANQPKIARKLQTLLDVGLGYVTLGQSATTLSGGEAQRIRLATQIGSSLMGVLYILDEPSIGLHQRDNDKLLATLKRLRDLGNTLIVVEHDEDTMRAADYLIDIGPGAGAHGGQVVACGTPAEVMANPNSLTGQYLSGKKKIEVPKERRKGNGNFLTVRGAQENNLKDLDVSIPLGTFTCVTGVSGSGKSSLVNEIIYKKLGADLNRMKVHPGRCRAIEGEEFLDKVICIDQSPIGRTPRSNPATYTNLFNDIRDLFASTPDAKARGYAAGRFSFNVRGGRCEACSGDGQLKIEMHFLPDIYVPCEVCKGKRYNRETLEVHYKGKSIADVLEMTVEEALEFFRDLPKLEAKLRTLSEVGLGYIRLGQSSTTLSGGEAQRVKLATELSKRSTGRTIYILDEPTTGLHTDDVKKLLEVLQRLVDAGNTVLVIEHNLDVIKCADYLLDLGPEGGSGGGTLVTCGTPEEVAACEQSYTGQYLRKMLR